MKRGAIAFMLLTAGSGTAMAQTAPLPPPPAASVGGPIARPPAGGSPIVGNGQVGPTENATTIPLQRSPFYDFAPPDRFFASAPRYQQTYQLMQRCGRCVVSSNSKRAQDLLTTSPNTQT